MKKEISPIGYIKSDYKSKFGIPRQSTLAPSLLSSIAFESEFNNEDFFRGIEEFSHLWIIWDFSENEGYSPTVRPPRLGGNEKRGVFATRSPYRPNSLGLSLVKLHSIGRDDNGNINIIISGGDMLDGTPIYDIKPYIPYVESVENAKGGFTENSKNHKLKVNIDDKILNLFPNEKKQALIESLQSDVRPAYHCDGREYGFVFYKYNVRFVINENEVTVLSAEIVD